MMRQSRRTRVRKEISGMPSLDCPRCEGSGYVQEDGGETIICARCEGTGVVFVDETAGDALSDAGD
jgi:DnaJ-class molecular chaperone